MKRSAVLIFCLLFFIAGLSVWVMGERNREKTSPYRKPKVPFKTGWKLNEIIAMPSEPIKVPFPRIIVTDIFDGVSMEFSDGKKAKLVGVTLFPENADSVREAKELARRLVENREVFYEKAADYQKEGDLENEYVYLYFRIPIIPSQPPVGPEYVHWSLNAELLKQGLAKVDDSVPFKHLERFREYEARAKEQKKGMWKNAA